MKISQRFAFLLPLILTIAAFAQVIRFDFVNYDDDKYVYGNPSIQQGITTQGLKWAFCADLCFDSPNADYWQPVTMISRMVDFQVWKMNPAGHHFTNLLIHIINVLLLYLIILGLSQRHWLAAFFAAAFAIHPAQVDIVPWITARKDVLSVFFGFAAILAYLEYVKKISWKRYAVILVLQACSLMAKPMFLTLPVFFLILDYWPLERWKSPAPKKKRREAGGSQFGKLVFEKSGFFFLSILSVWLIRSQSYTVTKGVSYPSEAPITILKYLRDFFYPWGISVFGPLPSGGRPAWEILLAVLSLFLVSWFLISSRKQRPFLLAGWLWFLVGLFPVVTIPHAGRFLPIASLGLCVLLGSSLILFFQSKTVPKWLQIIAVISLLGVWTWISSIQARNWMNSSSLGEYGLRTHPNSIQAHNTLARVFIDKQESDPDKAAQNKKAAEYHLKRAMELLPDSPKSLNSYGILLATQENYPAAIEKFNEALELSPQFIEARINISKCFLKMGKINEAISEYEKVLSQTTGDADMEFNYASMLTEAGRSEEAIRHFLRAIELKPDHAVAHNSLGILLANSGKPDEARSHFKEAVQVNPNYAEAYNNLGAMTAPLGHWDEAESYFKKALELNPNFESVKLSLLKLAEDKRKSELASQNPS